MLKLKSKWPAIWVLSAIAVVSGCGGGSDGGGGDSGGGSSGETVSISGSVSGLSSGQVTLANSDGSSTDLNTNGSFSFTIDQGASYDIRVDVNPLEQLCRVERGSDSSADEDFSGVEVSCESVAVATSCEGNADSDGDTLSDCDELEIHSTNPWLADTDGDSFDDGREAADYDPNNNRFVFNPRVADMATIAIELTAVPEVDLDFTESSGSSRSVSTSYETSESNSISDNWGGEVSRQLEVGHTFSVSNQQTVGTEISVSPTDLGGSVSYENSLTVGFESSTSQTRGSSVNWSSSATQENTRAFSETVDLTEQQNSSYNGGFLRVTARVRNDGHIPYDLENLTLSAVLFDPARPFDIESVGTMEFSGGGFPPTTILSGASEPLNFSTDLTLSKAQTLLRDSENIVITPGTFRLLNIDDQSLLLVDRDVSARTATVIIDYGIDAAREDKYRVSINRGDGTRTVSLADALQDILGLNVSEGAGTWTYANDASSSTTPAGLLQVGSYAMDNSTNRYWLMAHNRTDGASSGSRVTDYYNLLLDGYSLDNIQLRAGDLVNLVYVGDQDRDAISDRLEREIGTDRDDYDTDGDTLDDGLEVYGWLSNLGAPPCDVGDDLVRVYSNPLLTDSDEDGTSDADERANCENPSFDFIANAGEQQFANRNSQVTLSGSIEGIASGNPVYRWSLISGPDVIDSNSDVVRELEGRQPSFTTPDEVSTLVWELQATLDGVTQTDRVNVQVQQDRMAAVYVGTAGTGSADGTMDNPYPTLSEAINSLIPGDDLYIMTQSTPYVLVNTLNIPDGTSLFGGYDENWIRDVDAYRTPIQRETTSDPAVMNITRVSEEMWVSGFNVFANGNSSNILAGPENDVVAIQAESTQGDSTAPLYIADNVLESSNVATGSSASPGSSYALRISGLTSLRLLDNTLIAGNGGIGLTGDPGVTGRKGDDASSRTGGSTSGHSGGNGGNGGTSSGAFASGNPGGKGADVGSATGGSGGAGGPGGACKPGGVGGAGDPGADGADGSRAALPDYANLVFGYLPASGSNGVSGGHGAGGGGGGGGDGCGTAGGGRGGGGGEGGERGTRGFAGAGGGASIGIWIEDVSSSEMRRNQVSTGNGGVAGNGGRGGFGGAGGSYANGAAGSTVGPCPLCDRGASGNRGGNGGRGGHGGDGSGGNGGPSFGVYVAPGISPLLIGNTISSGNAGRGGFSYGNAGHGGDSYAVFDADINDGALPEVGVGNALTSGAAGSGGTTIGGSAGSQGNSGLANFNL